MRGLDITSRQEEEGGGVNLFKFKIKIIQLVILIDRRAVRKKKTKDARTGDACERSRSPPDVPLFRPSHEEKGA